jgi:CDP-4-dehydro-6-deoxyglucose reductase
MKMRPMPSWKTPGVELHIRHMPGGKFTDHVFAAMKENPARGRTAAFLREDGAKPIVMVASGTGFAPSECIIEHAVRRSASCVLYWGGRRPSTCT